MSKTNNFFETVDQIVSDGVQKGILHLYTEDDRLSGNSILLKGKEVINFGSCSYLGLEFDDRLKNAAKLAVDNYGTQFSESRAYVSVRQYAELEELLQQLFAAYCVVMPTTTLGHIANIPVLVNDTDAVIVDHQVHNSVQVAIQLLKARGVYIELLRHNRMDLLESRVKQLRSKHRKIWYMADGIYSMFGDASPVDEVYALMDKYPELHYYVDDAHGMSIYGKHGRGYVLNNRRFHPKMVMGTSLNKAFASGGGVMLYPDAELARRVRTCGGPLITSGPMQPAALGAAVAAARIHLSDEIYDMQADLQENIRFAQLMLKKYGLPVISTTGAAVFFIGVSLPKMGYNMIRRMLNAGYYLNLGIFPAVPMKNTGIRFTITRLHTFSQIERMVQTMAEEFPKALAEEGLTMAQIYKAFKMALPEDLSLDKAVAAVISQSLALKTSHSTSIQGVDRQLWNSLFHGNGTFDWEGMDLLERSFTGNEKPEDNWQFDYIVVSDTAGNPIVATFLTTGLWKDDMLSPGAISAQIEARRIAEPYYLTSKVICTGSLLTEGQHLYINRESSLWKDAMQLLFEKIYVLQEKNKAANIMLRDFDGIDEALDSFFVDNGYFRISMPDNNIVLTHTWHDREGFVQHLSANSRVNFKKYVARHEGKFITEIRKNPAPEELDYWYSLYLNVKDHSLALNTFTLPRKIFENIAAHPDWEIITLKVKDNYDFTGIEKPVCVIFCHKTADTYTPLVIGLDYSYHKEYNTYRQALYQIVMRAKQLNCKKVNLGFSAGTEKRKVGAVSRSTYAYMQTKDSFNFEVLAAMNTSSSAYKM